MVESQGRMREKKRFFQGDIERTGVTHCYISLVEIGHAVPWIEQSKSGAGA
jgi:hypothetical protein